MLSRWIGSCRVGLRLVLLATLTSITVLGLRGRRRLGRPCPHATLAIGQRWSRRMARLLGVRVGVRGAPIQGPALYLSNHRSYIDIVALLAQLPCTFLAKSEIGAWPLFGSAARLQGTVFVDRGCKQSRRAARAAAADVLRRGHAFAAFPEGTTTRGPGMLPFHPGLFEVAVEQGVPVVPVALAYADPGDAWVDDDSFVGHFLTCFRKRRIDVHLHFGPPLRGRDAVTLLRDTEAWIHASLAEVAFPAEQLATARPRRTGPALPAPA
jgi:1-acyl-sn-glycerol-3-phosphate acyltransferase